MQENIAKDITHFCNISAEHATPLAEQRINFYELTVILKGSITYFANGEKITLQKNDAVFLTPGTIRSREKSSMPVHYVSFNFTAGENALFPFGNHIQNCVSSDIKKLISVFPFSHLSSGFHSREKCLNILNYILFELIDFHHLNCKNNHVLEILKYINGHITEKITLSNIAGHLYLSKEYTSYIFKKETGKQLMSYINEQKSLLAKSMIINDNIPLSDVWSYLGFDSYDYFSKTFKKYIGVTPSFIKRTF